MRAPFATLPPAARGPLLAALTVGLAGLSLLLAVLDAPLAHAGAPHGIVSFELAGSRDAAAAVLAGWDDAERVRAGLALGLDAVYLLVYPAWLALAVGGLAARLSRGAGSGVASAARRAGVRAGPVLAWAVLLAAPLDAVENAALAVQLLHGAGAAAARLAAACAAPKFALVAAAAAYVLAAGLASATDALRARGAGPRRLDGPVR